jgi:predicted flap endonuclease-1-like 5' DNA nuclease
MTRFMRGILIGLLLGWWLALRWKRQERELTPATHELLVESWRELQTSGVTTPAGQSLAVAARKTTQAQGDRLEEIHGIGPVFANHLRQAGISTFAALARTDPETLHGILASSGGRQLANVEDWIEEARQLARGAA